MVSNFRRHEIVGMIQIFLAATFFGIGLYITFWTALRPLYYGSLDYMISGKEILLFPLFYGVSALLWILGKIELKEALPGRGKKW
jgi:hypothetical protein|tara:strand:+ start:45 stop:299 length:255 start_codon:yes stop_codon:yes gene_type:complete